jgi:hypothetical protein
MLYGVSTYKWQQEFQRLIYYSAYLPIQQYDQLPIPILYIKDVGMRGFSSETDYLYRVFIFHIY